MLKICVSYQSKPEISNTVFCQLAMAAVISVCAVITQCVADLFIDYSQKMSGVVAASRLIIEPSYRALYGVCEFTRIMFLNV